MSNAPGQTDLAHDLTAARVGDPEVEVAAPAELAALGEFLAHVYGSSFTITPAYRDGLLHLERAIDDFEPWVVRGTGGEGYLGAVLVSRPGSPATEPFVSDSPTLRADDVLTYRFLAVAHEARGQGIARLLLAAIDAEARRRGTRQIAIRSGPQMTSAHRLYETSGYERQPELETLVVDGGQRLRRYHRDL